VKDGIHPKYYPDAKVVCACGNTWTTGSTVPELRTEICSNCHPFYTGQQQRLVDTEGRVERFERRVQEAQERREVEAARATAREERRKARALVEIVDEDEELEPIDDLLQENEEE